MLYKDRHPGGLAGPLGEGNLSIADGTAEATGPAREPQHVAAAPTAAEDSDGLLPFHEFANLFPLMQGGDLALLREDIARHGVLEPVVMLGGAILDGRNRHRCARELGVPCPAREFDGADPLAFVFSANLARRHLDETQRASIGARIANLGNGQRADLRSANLPTLPFAEEMPPPVSQADASRMLNVSERSIRSAKKVHDEAPELVPFMDAGTLSVSLAAQVAALPPEEIQDVVNSAPEETRSVARAHVANNSGNNEWYTPRLYLDAARSVLGGFDLDPASSEIANRRVQAARFFTAAEDGLAQEWPIGRIWMNPPYSQPLIGQFADRLAEEVCRGSAAIVLVNNATETAWFQRVAAECSAICFPRGRVRFVDPDGKSGSSPLQGQAILYAGSDPDLFEEAFSLFGLVVRRAGAAA